MENILVVSSHIPNFDNNAGDWRCYSLCKGLRNRFNVFLLPLMHNWCTDRHEKLLRSAGVRIVLPGIDNSKRFRVFLRKKNINAVIFQKHGALRAFKGLLPYFKHVIIDTHELQFEKNIRAARLGGQSLAPKLYEMAAITKQTEISDLLNADILIAISGSDANKLKKISPSADVVVIPTPFQRAQKWQKLPGYRERKGLVFFGSFGYGSANDDAVIYFTRQILPAIRRKMPKVPFNVIGHKAGIFKGICKNVHTLENIPDIQQELSKYRVFICPLRIGAGVKKKVIDALVSGTPVVSTPVGAEGTGLADTRELYVASKPELFASRVVELYRDKDVWLKLSRSGYAYALDNYSKKSMQNGIQSLYSILGSEG